MDLLMHLLKAIKDFKLIKISFIIYIFTNIFIAAYPILITVIQSMNDDQALIIDYQPLMADLLVLLKNSAIMFSSYMFLKILYGRDISLWMNRYFTEQYVIKRMPNIVKITGPTGAGKDTTGVAMSILLRNQFKKMIKERMREIEDILYQIDLKKIHDHFQINYKEYIITDEDIYDKDINKYLTSDDFVKSSYRHMWVWNDIFTAYVKKELEKRFMRYHAYSQIYIIDIIKEYISLVIRIQVDNYIMANQPIKEADGVMAKIFSNNFVKLMHDDSVVYQKKQYQENVQFPYIPYMVIYETESDAWWNNVDPGIRGTILKYGIRNFKAFQRHILGEHIYMISIGQNAGRQNKLLRELDHAVLFVVDKIESEGHPKTRFILSVGSAFISLGIFITKPIKSVCHRLQHIKSKLKNYQEKLKDYGHIEVDIIISANDESGTIESIKIEDIIAKRLFRVRYSTRLTFKATDTRGRYNTHYLDVIASDLKKKSNINILNVPNWSPSLKMDKKSARYINSAILNDSLQIPKEAIFEIFYKVIKDLSEKKE
jgi:hypothetical protein